VILQQHDTEDWFVICLHYAHLPQEFWETLFCVMVFQFLATKTHKALVHQETLVMNQAINTTLAMFWQFTLHCCSRLELDHV